MAENPDQQRRWLIGLILILLVVATLNLVLMLKLSLVMPDLCPPAGERRPLPCEAVPVKFLLENPECADKLLKAMNVTNTRVLQSTGQRGRIP